MVVGPAAGGGHRLPASFKGRHPSHKAPRPWRLCHRGGCRKSLYAEDSDEDKDEEALARRA